ncbi:hypothetical protein ACG04R_04165 [Roseateles sp. BYS78W]|uniref:Uncharacterized protein n=1 Tax=Pelomonas candidula TaxID=3299025 RepID=A0ABW7H7J2_9BURK
MKIIAGCIGLLVMAQAAAADLHPLLAQLSADLTRARSLPMGTRTDYACPANLDQLNGFKLVEVVAALPKPDFEMKNSAGFFPTSFEAGASASYFLTSPTPAGRRGGGFPEISFIADTSGTVRKITCHYSR